MFQDLLCQARHISTWDLDPISIFVDGLVYIQIAALQRDALPHFPLLASPGRAGGMRVSGLAQNRPQPSALASGIRVSKRGSRCR